MTRTIEVMYSCVCGLHRVKVNVPGRLPEQDVVYWLREVCTPALARDHAARSPLCRSSQLKELMIPIDNDKPVGSPVEKKVN